MANDAPQRPRFGYDDDPDLRDIEKQLELPGLLQKAAAAQARARARRRLRGLFLAALLTAAAGLGWWIFQRPKTPGPPPALEQKSIAPEEDPPAQAPRPAPPPPVEKPEKAPSKTPGGFQSPKEPSPVVVIAFGGRPEDFAPEFRAVVSALKTGRLDEAERQLALLEKSHLPEDEVRALDEDEEARLDTLLFLKGLTMLQLRRFPEAAAAFSRLDEEEKPWRQEAQFYLFQAYFLASQRARAEAVLEKMRRTPGHRFLKTAEDWGGGRE